MEKQKKSPALRFSEFTERWVRKKLGDVAPLQRGFDLPVDKIIKGQYPVVFSNGILKFHNEFKAKAPGVVTGRSGTIGKVTFVEKDYWPHNTSLWVTNFMDNYPKFIYYFYSKYNLERFGTGSGVPTLNRNDVHSQEEYFPSKTEQQKIATFFTAIDKKLSLMKEKKNFLTEYKKGVMQQLFSKALRFKNTKGVDFEDWEVKKLGEVTYKTDQKNKENIPYPVYSINNKEGFLPQSDQFDGMDSHDRGYDVSLYKIIQANTFAYNPARIDVGSIGYSGDLDNIIISSLYVCFKTKSKLNDNFLMIYLKSDAFNKYVLSKTEGGVRKYLFYENFSDIVIPLPSVEEQTQIANFLNALDEKIQAVSTQMEKMERWKKGLLQQMFV